MKPLRILVGCERSGRVRDAFRKRGHDAISCDLEATDVEGPHHRGDLFEIINDGFDLVIVHPPCTYLTNSGAWCFKENPGKKMKPTTLIGAARSAAREEALQFVTRCWQSTAKRVVLENPQGCINTRLSFMPRPQVIQPYDFGDDASKGTCLWLRNTPPLLGTQYVVPRLICKQCKGRNEYEGSFGRGCVHCGAEAGMLQPRWANQTDSGQNKLAPSDDRAKLRSDTFPGIAEAMADQWGRLQ
jgi:hypothetical protein